MARELEIAIRAMSGPFEWGKRDCCLAAWSAFVTANGLDIAPPYFGKYQDRKGAISILRSHGGMLLMARDLSAWLQLIPGTGAAGEIGVVSDRSGGNVMGFGIGGGHWAAKTRAGLTITRKLLDGSWSCPKQ